jgi:hypothetical protein
MHGKCENPKFQSDDYLLKYNMFTIEMGGCDLILGVQWLCILSPITMDFKELYMSFNKEGHPYNLNGIQLDSHEIINYHCMETLLKKGLFSIISQFNAIKVLEDSPHTIHLDF